MKLSSRTTIVALACIVLGALQMVDALSHVGGGRSSDLVVTSSLVSAIVLAGLGAGFLRRGHAAIRSEGRYAALIQSMPDAVIVVDHRGSIRSANHAAHAMLGYGANELPGQSIGPMFASTAEYIAAAAVQAREPGRVTTCQTVQIRRKDGSVFPLEFSSCAMSPGTAADRIIVGRDVSARARTEQQLAESEGRFRAISEVAPLGILLLDPDGAGVYVNSAFSSISGQAPEQALGTGWADAIHPEDLLAMSTAWAERLARGESFSTSVRFFRPDGSIKWATGHIAPMRSGEQIVGTLAIIEDTSERRHAEDALAASERFANAILEHAPIGIQIYDADGSLQRMNEAQWALLGLPSDSYGPGMFNALTDPIARESGLSGIFKRAVAGEIVEEVGMVIDLGSDANAWDTGRQKLVVDRLLFAVPDEHGQTASVVAIMQDARERVAGEEALRQSEQNHRTILDSAPNPMFVLDRQPGDSFRFSLVNSACRTLFAADAAHIVGKTVREVTGRWGAKHFERYETAAISSGAPVTYNLTSPQDSGDVYLLVRLTPVFEADGACLRLIGSAADITELRHAKDQLRSARDEYQTIFNATGDPITVLEEGANQELRYRFVNTAFLNWMHMSEAEVIGKTIRELLGDPAGGEVKAHHDAAIASGEGQAYEVTFERAGRETTCTTLLAPLKGDDGRVLRLIATMHDVTLEREARRRIQEARQLESLRTLAVGIAHDFNNILTVIRAASSLIKLEMAESEMSRSLFEDIEDSVRRAMALVVRMLDYAGARHLKREQVNLSSLISTVNPSAFAPGSAVIERKTIDEGMYVDGDTEQLRQAVLNLVENALEACVEGESGPIRISARRARLDGDWFAAAQLAPGLPSGDYAVVEVTDSGPGMDDETLSRAFEPFFTTRFQGRGLGLPGTLGIVRAHGGALRANSAPGRGASFAIALPLCPEPDEPLSKAS